MQSLFRNILFLSALIFISIIIIKCGPNKEPVESKNIILENTYKNLDSNVKYVGIMACRQCHYDKYETFIETGMGKSFDHANKNKSSAKFNKHDVIYDKHLNLSYLPFWEGDSMKILEFRLKGKDTTYRRVEAVDYIIGSGQHTNSHIMNTNGYLTQMPLTYYTQKGKWDLPPGFEAGFNSRFSRKIGLECMSCHNSLPDFVIGSENKFNDIPTGINCERCHGPGEIHVKEKTAGILVDTSTYIDYSIVNPAKLSIDLQFDVCQRCHLQGNAVLKENKSFFDFKPGMKLSDVLTVFLPKYEGAEDEFIMASHADRLKMSKCFIQSNKSKTDNKTLRPYEKGLTCITCHNPHVSVHVTGKEIFNKACISCHNNQQNAITNVECSEDLKKRTAAIDNCVSCHMPRSGAIDIPHVTVTDHFIQKPVKKINSESVKRFIGLYAVNEKNPSSQVIAQAYINQYDKFDRKLSHLDSAKKHLNEKNISDFNILIQLYFLKTDYQKIVSLMSTQNQNLWLRDCKITFDNKDAWTCYWIAEAYNQLNKPDIANIFYKKATILAPYNLELQNKLAGNYHALNKIEEAKQVYEKIIEEDKTFAPAWSNLGFMYVQQNNIGMATNLYDKALTLDPNYEQALTNKAGLLIYEKKTEEAIKIADRILILNPENRYALSLKEHFKK